MQTTEEKYDRLLHIKTTGRDDSHSDQYRFPYEPTPYPVLERLANAGYIRKGNTLLDYGCGKGRVDFFLAWQTRCRTIGVEYDERIFEKAEENQKTAVSAARTAFQLANAEAFRCRSMWTGSIFSIPFLWRFFRRLLPGFWNPGMRRPESF